jgi:tRNA A-37 threonylcarbamoyl transferase component Bud32
MADSVIHLQSHQIVHTSLNARNFMVKTVDGKPMIKLFDFGASVAKEQQEYDMSSFGAAI